VRKYSDIRQKDSNFKLSTATKKHLNSFVISTASVMTHFAFRVTLRGPEYKVEDRLCSDYIKETRRRRQEKGIKIKEMEERHHFICTATLALKMGSI
jgi:hypothetical protein